ncbi:MAG: penicillin-binding protein [Bryobacteraceae bacterium]|jgi:cell division protein FtsI (penicillin-binding protein 3)
MLDRRLKWLAGIILVWGGAILCKLISLQVLHHRQYAGLARARQEQVVKILAPRGAILDRTGAPLAMSVPTQSIFVNPLKVPDLGVAADILSMVLRMDRADLYARLQAARDDGRGYFVVKKKAAWEEAQRLRGMGFDWIQIDSGSERHYPNGSLAAHILGGVDFAEKGNSGIEKALETELEGAAGEELALTDVRGRRLDALLEWEPKPGITLTLTIDERLQFVAERELAAQAEVKGAHSGSVVVMNPQTGEILALASYPPYDPNRPPDVTENPEARLNHSSSVPFEPGSVFKVVTLAAALETTQLRPESMIDCGRGSITLFGRTVHEAHGGYGVISMADVLKHSSNVGAIRIGMTVGEAHMHEYVRRFGFGERTGVPLPAESRGRLRNLDRWSKASLPSISIGQEVSVTALQLAQAASIIANGGLLVRPRLVLKKGNQTVPAPAPVRAIKSETAVTMRQMMEGVVLPGGTGYPEARLEGYSAAGKTGSAQIYDVAAKRYTHYYNGSFIGFAPLNNPAIVVVVTLNGTHGNLGFGGRAAAPVFHAVAAEALRVLDVPKDLPEAPPQAQAADNAADKDDLAIADLGSHGPNILEESEEDAAVTPATVLTGPTVPDFTGMTMRAVLAEAAERGLPVIPDGSGVARLQRPPAGSPLRQGERIRVRFSR